jgi:hypothetical protein
MDQQQQEAFKAAVDRKKRESEAASHQDGPPPRGQSAVSGDQPGLTSDDRGNDDPRKTNSKHGQVTADKWNQ